MIPTFSAVSRRGAALFVRHLNDLRRALRHYKVIHVIRDNAGFHTPEKSKVLRAYLVEWVGRVVLHYLSTYSPDCNPVEHVWWRLHEVVTAAERQRVQAEQSRGRFPRSEADERDAPKPGESGGETVPQREGEGGEAGAHGHALNENRNGLIVGIRATEANGSAERRAALELVDGLKSKHGKTPKTVGACRPVGR